MENGHGNGYATRIEPDPYTRSIIDHATNLYNSQTPYWDRGGSAGCSTNGPLFSNPLRQDDGDFPLDDFDRQLLGSLPQPRNDSIDGFRPRVSLPHTRSGSPRRVLGDTSRHFAPHMPQAPGFTSHIVPLCQNNTREEASPASQAIFNRDSSRRLGELYARNQLVTPPMNNAAYERSSPAVLSAQPSSSEFDGSSPSARLSVRQQIKHASQNYNISSLPQTLSFNLDHAPNYAPTIRNTELINPRQALPDSLGEVFPYPLFNYVQSKCFPLVFGSPDNVVISAPTGSGKTAILEMAICRLVVTQKMETYKVVYQAPTKSLCSERSRDWDKKFRHLGMRCVELTGDTSQSEARRVGSANIIVTTPEKWDSITRKWSDHRKLLDMIKLVLIDEVHILSDVRGATLEAVVSRMKTIGQEVRFIALSATVPNINDVSKWLGLNSKNRHEPALCERFGEELRPVKLQKHVYGYDGAANHYVFEKSLDGKLSMLLAKHSQKKPIMVFCFTRKSCEKTARSLAEWWSSSQLEHKAWPAPTGRIAVVSDELQELVRYGVAFHHAGLDVMDRAVIEQNFLSGQLHVICCTSTLAVGVNLPCHTVVLKGTQGYTDAGTQEYSDLEIMQMLGRAGRPQFDSSAVAIIMTRRENVDKYQKMISGEEVLESTLHKSLLEHLNSEIGLGTIRDIQTAKEWVSGTFLAVRMGQNPQHYKTDGPNTEITDADRAVEAWCEQDIALLQKSNLVTASEPFACTEYGGAMSRYMLQFETMQILLAIPRAAKMGEVLSSTTKAAEFKDFRLRANEKALFRQINQSPFIMFPVQETLNQTWQKVSLLVQIHLGAAEIPASKDFSSLRRKISVEKSLVFDRMNRLVRCLIDCKAWDGDSIGTRTALELARALAACSWEGKSTQLTQIPNIGPVGMRKLVSAGIQTVAGLARQGFDDIERIMSRNPPFGKNLLKELENFPRLSLNCEIANHKGGLVREQGSISITICATLSCLNPKMPPSWLNKIPSVTFLVESSTGDLAYFWRGNIKELTHNNGLVLEFPVPIHGLKETFSCYFSCEEIVGTQVMKTIAPKIPSSVFEDLTKLEPCSREYRSNIQEPIYNGDVEDQDMLTALDNIEVMTDGTKFEDILEEMEQGVPGSSVANQDVNTVSLDGHTQDTPMEIMANGRFVCNHHCRNNGLTKAGKPCTHRCCHEGLEKPRKQAAKKRTDPKEAGRKDTSVPENIKLHQATAKKRTLEDRSTAFSHAEPKRSKPSSGPHPVKLPGSLSSNQPRMRESDPDVVSYYLKEPKRHAPPSLAANDDTESETAVQALRSSDLECVDLTGFSDDDEKERMVQNKTVEIPPKNQTSGLVEPEYRVQRNKMCRSNPLSAGFPNPRPNVVSRGIGIPTSDFKEDELNEELFPDLDRLFPLQKFAKSIGMQKTPDFDKRLCVDGVETPNKYIESGCGINIGFSMVSEAHYIPQREERPSTCSREGPTKGADPPERSFPSSLLDEHVICPSNDTSEGGGKGDNMGSSTQLDNPPTIPCSDEAAPPADTGHISAGAQTEPAWLAEFDPDFINEFRGCVNFVD